MYCDIVIVQSAEQGYYNEYDLPWNTLLVELFTCLTIIKTFAHTAGHGRISATQIELALNAVTHHVLQDSKDSPKI